MMFESQFINANVITTSRAAGYSGESNNISRSASKSTLNTNYENITLTADSHTSRLSVSMTPSGCNKKISMSENQQPQQQVDTVTTALPLEKQILGMHISDQQFPLCFQAKRHKEIIEGLNYERQSWRIRERMKTASVALVLCLNIGVDPPDVVKIQPCARLECWVDPSSVSAPKAMELIGNNLQIQYERWQPRARYKKCHDPTVEDVKKLCTSLRRNAKGERILFHYNGHGVPKPTSNGEIWVFNKTFTQYIPLSIFELQSWMAAPSIYVYDCSNAGIIINSFHQFAEQHERDLEKAISLSGIQRFNAANGAMSGPQTQLPPIVSYKNCIHLAACSANQILPMNAKLPADLFTSCLTTPINIALRWYTMQAKFELVPQIQNDFIDKIPGKVNDRRTMMGELNWIFTAITDTIAWNTLPRELFQRLFRQDLLVASLFRNFLLAERILRSHDCTPVSHPALPQCFRHPMWSAWDLVVDLALQQLPDILERGVPYRQLPFFEEQLTAFQVWLDRESESRAPPEQLPIVLQVLLSQVHRLRALELLARFLDLGPWAVNLALGVGIFPYVLKLLQSSAKELRPVLVFIWAKILAVDPSCQVDLVKDYKYFLAVLQDNSISKEHRTLAAFILACIVNNFLLGQTSALQGSLVSICLEQLNDESWLLRQWLAICLGMLWQNFEKARWSGVRDLAHEKLYPLLKDNIPEVRAAAVFALGTFISSVTDRSEEHANNIDRIIAITLLETVGEDMSPLVRLELASALQWMVLLFETQFVTVYMQEHISNSMVAVSGGGERIANLNHTLPSQMQGTVGSQNQFSLHHHHHHSTHSLERHVTMRRGLSSSSISNMATSNTTIPFQSLYTKLWQGIYYLGNDPFPKVAETAQKIIAYVRDAALCMITAKEATSAEKCFTLSVSLPPSPNTRMNYLGGETSPTVGQQQQQQTSQQQQQQHNAATAWATKLRNNEPQNLLHRKLRTTSMNDETDSMNQSHTAIIGNPSLGGGNGGGCGSGGSVVGDGSASARSSTSDNNFDSKSGHNVLRPIVTTEFIPWTISYFARPGKTRYTTGGGGDGNEGGENEQLFPIDKNSIELRTRCYRFQRNQQIRKNAHRENEHQIPRIDTQIWLRKTQFSPSIVSFMTYETQMAVACKEKVIVYDWNKNTTRTYQPTSTTSDNITALTSSLGGTKSQHSSMLTARVNAIEFLNAHDVSLILAGHEDGIIRVWKPQQNHEECSEKPTLITAWEGLPSSSFNCAMNTFNSLSNTNAASNTVVSAVSATTTAKHQRTCSNSGSSSNIYGIVTAWQQSTQQLIVGGGNCRFLRVWDVNAELKLMDIPLGSNETNVRVLSPFPSYMHSDLIVAGCMDGSVRLYDKRCPIQESRIRVYREHSSTILAACLKENQTSLVTACSQGKMCVIDFRCTGPESVLQQWDVSNEITAVAVHQSADLVACGSSHKISIYNSNNGRLNNVLRSNESFMSQKIGQPNCLAFHKLKLSLAVGFVDNAIAIYETPTGRQTYAEFYKLCNRWKQDVDNNPQTYENAYRFLHGPEMTQALQFIEQKTQITNITAKQAQYIYTICAFETAWHRHRATSIWCNLFNRNTIKVLEFVEDLEYYWIDGYGYNITQQIACPALADMFDSIDPQSNKPNATFYFTHSGTLLKMLVHLGLYRDPEPLTYRDYGKERLWQTSKIDAFATNLAFILYDCETEPMVLAMHQERTVHIPNCPIDKELCSLHTLRKIFKSSLNNCNFDETCALKE